MAIRRMFSKKITNSARFLKMPASSRLLYYDLGMAADDDGVVEAFTVLKMSSASEDDLEILVNRGFLTLLNEDYVAYIEDWRENNYIRNDRYQESIYIDLLEAYLGDRKAAGGQESPQRPTDGQEAHQEPPAGQEASKEPSGGQEAVQPPEPAQKPVQLPLRNGSSYEVPPDKAADLAAAFPGVDVADELKRMALWFSANPGKRRDRKDMEQFIRRWLGRARSRPEKKGGRQARAGTSNRFNNFQQREYDYKELEKELLQAGKS